MVMTLRDYAKDIGVSYEAVRQQVKRYSKDLVGHIHQDGRTQYLDEVAVNFLNTKRARNPVVIYDKGRDDRLQELEEENKALLKDLNRAKDRIIDLQGAQARLEAAEAAQKALEASRDDAKAEAARNAQKAAEEALRAEQAIREAQELRSRLEASEAREKALKERTWLERLMRKGE